jgi:hypothetical protein
MSLIAAGMLLQGASSLFGAAGSKRAARDQIKISKLNASLIGEETAEETRRLQREIDKTEGMAVAASAASGVQMSGSRELAIKDVRQENSSQLAWLRKSGKQKAKVVLAGGQLQASQLRSQAATQMIGGLTSIGTGLFGQQGLFS